MTPATEYFGRSPKKKGRGKSRASLELIDAAYGIAERLHPMTVRGIAYKLFAAGVIPSMKKGQTKRVSRLLVDAREEGTIPWEWIVDEKRRTERAPSWRDADAFLRSVRWQYRKNLWADQPRRVTLVSEKGTVRGVVRPVLDELGVGFLAVGGFSGATTVHDLADDYDGRPHVLLYIGDWDPSGMFMSERDLPGRLEKYGGDHTEVRRIALIPEDTPDLSSFPASSKKKDSRFAWFVENYGERCWELDAMDENDLRARVHQAVVGEIEGDAWDRGVRAQEAEQESLEALFDSWTAGAG